MKLIKKMHFFHKRLNLRSFARNLNTVIGIVLIWRGIWYVMDKLDVLLFGGSHIWTAVLGIVAGICILYLPDKDLDELGKL